MKRYIVLKPGISIDKTNGMAYNELVKHAEFIGVETGDGIMKDEIGGGTYSFHEIFSDNGNLRNTFEKSSIGVYVCENLVFYGKEYKISLKKNGNPAGDFVGSIRWNLNLKEQAIVSPIGTVLSALGFVCESRSDCYLYRMPGDSSFQGIILKSKFGKEYLDEVSVVNFQKGIGKYFTYTLQSKGSIDDGTMVTEIDIIIPEGLGDVSYEIRKIKYLTYYYELNWRLKGNLYEGDEVKVIKPKPNPEVLDAEGEPCVLILYKDNIYWVCESDIDWNELKGSGAINYKTQTVKTLTYYYGLKWKPVRNLYEGDKVKVIMPKPNPEVLDAEGEPCVLIFYKNFIYWACESDLQEPESSGQVVIAVAGEDKKSGHNAFKDNLITFKSVNPAMDVRVINADDYNSAEDVMHEIISLSKSINGGIDHLRIEAHSDTNGITLKYEDQLVPGSGWDKIAFRNDAYIRFTGCNTGGTDGIKSKDSIAQKVSNKTGKIVYGFLNSTSQKYVDGRYFQEPVPKYYGQYVVYDYTKFVPEN